jgi:hypothetical protein
LICARTPTVTSQARRVAGKMRIRTFGNLPLHLVWGHKQLGRRFSSIALFEVLDACIVTRRNFIAVPARIPSKSTHLAELSGFSNKSFRILQITVAE